MLSGNYPLVYFGYRISEGPARVLWSMIFIAIIVTKLRLKIKIRPIFLIFYGAFVLLTVLQNIYLDSFFLPEFLNLSFLFFITYLIVFAIGLNGLLYIPRLMVGLVKWSFIFYIPSAILFILGINWSGLISNIGTQSNSARIGTSRKPLHMIFHNFSGLFSDFSHASNSLLPRNSGLFWEPGAFAGIIVMTFILVIIYKRYFTLLELRIINKWIFVGLLSTFSTTALACIPLLIVIYYIRDKKVSAKFSIRFVFFVAMIASISIVAFSNIPVLKNKISTQIQSVENNERGSETTRLGSFIMLSEIINDSPALGAGFASNRQAFSDKMFSLGYEFTDIGIGNGMFLMLAWCGIPFFVFMLCLMGYGFYSVDMSLGVTVGLILIILLLLQGESWMRLPMIYSFCFLAVHRRIQQS